MWTEVKWSICLSKYLSDHNDIRTMMFLGLRKVVYCQCWLQSDICSSVEWLDSYTLYYICGCIVCVARSHVCVCVCVCVCPHVFVHVCVCVHVCMCVCMCCACVGVAVAVSIDIFCLCCYLHFKFSSTHTHCMTWLHVTWALCKHYAYLWFIGHSDSSLAEVSSGGY